MKIAQVVTLLTGSGAFGGPFAVAVEQCRALTELGHDVSLFFGWDGMAPLPAARFRTRPFPVWRAVPPAGLSGLISPPLVRALRGEADGFDVVHVHMGRDLVSTTAARRALAHRPTFLQTHGMVMPDRRVRARLIDALFTRRLLRDAQAVFYLTETERRGLADVLGAPPRLVHLRNGVSELDGSDRGTRMIGRPPTVLFCARLHSRKRVSAFLHMAELLEHRGRELKFVVAGPDDGDLPLVKAFLTSHPSANFEYVGALDAIQARTAIAAADVMVLPSVDEPFPMTVLESLSLGTPAVITNSTGISRELEACGAARVTDGSPHQLASAVAELVTDQALWSAQAERGRSTVLRQFSIDSVARTLLDSYERGRTN